MKLLPWAAGSFISALLCGAHPAAFAQIITVSHQSIILHAARLVEVETGRVVSPGEVLIVGDHIVASGPSVNRPAGAEVIDLGSVQKLNPGDAAGILTASEA
jgi:hypothetical protein